MSTQPVQNNGAQFAMISLAALQNSKLAGEFICEIDSSNCTETITYFQQAQNFTSSFACFTQQLQQQGQRQVPATSGGEVVFNISRVGDVLLGLTAVITLPNLESLPQSPASGTGDSLYHGCAWVENIGHHIINKCELLAQDTVVESFGTPGGGPGNGVYGAFMDCHMGMTNQAGKNDLYNTMIGNRPELTSFVQRTGQYANLKSSNNLYCPLQLSFCAKNDSGVPAAPLPVCALAYCTLQVKLGLNSMYNVTQMSSVPVALLQAGATGAAAAAAADAAAAAGGDENPVVGAVATGGDAAASNVVQATPAAVGTLGNDQISVSMLAEYAMVSSQERAALACAKTTQHVLHRQAFATTYNAATATATTTTNQITFSGCNAFWWSLWQNTGLTLSASAGTDGYVDHTKSGNVFSSNYTNGHKHCVIGRVGQASIHNTIIVDGMSGEVGEGGVGVQLGQNPVSAIKINADSSPIIDITDEITSWYNWWWKTANTGVYGYKPADLAGPGCGTNAITPGINLIPFCLTTEFYAIEANGGFLNLSKLTNVTETTTFKDQVKASGPLTSVTDIVGHTNLILDPPASTTAAPVPPEAHLYPIVAQTAAIAEQHIYAVPVHYNHYVLSVSYNSIVVSGGTLQHPYY